TLGVHGIPLLIDPGTGCYTTDAGVRDRLRSTALHNTLLVDDRAQSAPDGPFHWATTANATVHRWRANGAFDYFDGAHDGYRPLAQMWMVTAIGLNPENSIVDVDDLPVWAEAGVLGRSTAVRIRRTQSVDYVLFVHPAGDATTTWRIGELETDARVMFCRM